MTVYFKAILVLIPFSFALYLFYVGLNAALNVVLDLVGLDQWMIEINIYFPIMCAFVFTSIAFVMAMISSTIDYFKCGRFLDKSPYIVQHVIADDPNEKYWSNTIYGNRHHRVFSFEKVVSHDGLLAYALYLGKHQLRWGKVN